MNSGRVKIFAAKKAENAHSLVGILKQYNIEAEVVSRNEVHEIHVLPDFSEAAKVIINKNIKKPGERALNIPKASFVEQHRVTVAIVGILILAFFLTSFGRYMDNTRYLFFSDIDYIRSVKDNRFVEVAQYNNSLTEITNGQVWRIITPSLLHKNLIHFLLIIAFMIQLGRTIESISGRFYLICLCTVSAIASNFLEFKLSGVHFGGMSGVILCLYGFIWMRSTADVKYAGKLHSIFHIFMAALILSGLMDIFFVNNRYGCIGGLAIGLIWGICSTKFLPQNRLIPKKQNLY